MVPLTLLFIFERIDCLYKYVMYVCSFEFVVCIACSLSQSPSFCLAASSLQHIHRLHNFLYENIEFVLLYFTTLLLFLVSLFLFAYISWMARFRLRLTKPYSFNTRDELVTVQCLTICANPIWRWLLVHFFLTYFYYYLFYLFFLTKQWR